MSVKTVEDMVEWVEKNIENEPTLDRMATDMGYSNRYGFSSHEAFTRAFRKSYGYSPSYFRTNRPPILLHEKENII